jgi:hypothetical protein
VGDKSRRDEGGEGSACSVKVHRLVLRLGLVSNGLRVVLSNSAFLPAPPKNWLATTTSLRATVQSNSSRLKLFLCSQPVWSLHEPTLGRLQQSVVEQLLAQGACR